MNWIIQNLARRRLSALKKPMKLVAIIVPTSSSKLSDDEKVSMLHLQTFLSDYERYLVVPKGLKIELDGFLVIKLDRKHFGSAANHNRLLYRANFWEIFADYEYVLMYHLDALVFSDQLREWCHKGLDFVGAPFVKSADLPWVTIERVGNGGFALYRVSSILKVLWNRYIDNPSVYFEDNFWKLLGYQRRVLGPLRAAMPLWLRGRATAPLRKHLRRMDHAEINERGNDIFWSDEARCYWPHFKVASLEEGLAFAFESDPSGCFERTGKQLPFGCHAWSRYDKNFWIPYLMACASQNPRKPSIV